jgi:hypothetical protein
MDVLEFTRCLKYRLGVTNDEGFYLGQYRFSRTGVQWGNFYHIIDSNWITEFPKDEVLVDRSIDNNPLLNHYLFYFRDETYECIAESYRFVILKIEL